MNAAERMFRVADAAGTPGGEGSKAVRQTLGALLNEMLTALQGGLSLAEQPLVLRCAHFGL